MNLDVTHSILFVIGIIALIKCIWGLGWPSSTKSLGLWWSKAAMQVNTLTGCIYILVAVALWIAVLIHEPLANVLVALFGVLMAWVGTLYFRPEEFQKLIRAVVLNRSLVAIRVISLITGAVSVILIVIAIKGL